MASRPFDLNRAAGDNPHGARRHRLFPRHQEQRSGAVYVRIKIRKFVALAGRMPGGRRLARSHWARLDAGEVRGVMSEATGRPELAIADAIDPGFDLPPHRFRDGWCDLRGDYRGVRDLGARQPGWHVFPTLGRR